MPADAIMYGPESEPYNSYTAVSPAPGDNGIGGQIAQRGRNPLGQQLVLQDGRKYRFFLKGTGAAIPGDVQSSAAIITTDQSMACAIGVVGDRIITYTHGGATTVINFFAEGYALITLDPGQGQTFKIASHAAIGSGTVGSVVNLAAGNSLQVAITTTSDLSLLAHPYASNIIMAATIAAMPVGIAVVATPAASFGWLQTRGSCGVRGAASLAIGSPAVMLLTGGTAGAVAPASAATQPQVGFVQMLEGTGEASGIFLTIDG